MNAIPAGGGFSFSLGSIGGTWKWTVLASNLQGPGLLYQVQDILTPYGPLTVAAIPLPGDVVQSMAQSVTDVQNQMKPHMTVVSSQTSFSMGVTEGDPRVNVGSVQIRNDGGFGSFLSATATPDVPWLTVLTPEITGIARGATAQFSFDLVPDTLLATQSPFVGHIRIQDTSDSSSYAIMTVSVLVLPRPAIGVSTQSVALSYSLETPAPANFYVTVSNLGPGTSSLNYSTLKVGNAAWLVVAPNSGGPIASGGNELIQLSLALPVSAALGEHVETVRISSQNASNSPVDVTVTMTVTL